MGKDLEKAQENLTANQRKIIELMLSNSTITQDELSIQIRINPKNNRNNIAKLKQMGGVERIGPDKGGYWRVNV